jgi:hypothetical protein
MCTSAAAAAAGATATAAAGLPAMLLPGCEQGAWVFSAFYFVAMLLLVCLLCASPAPCIQIPLDKANQRKHK